MQDCMETTSKGPASLACRMPCAKGSEWQPSTVNVASKREAWRSARTWSTETAATSKAMYSFTRASLHLFRLPPLRPFRNPNRAPCPVGHYDRPKAGRGKSRVHKTCDQDRLYPVVKQHIPIICETRLTPGGSYDGLPLHLARCRWPCPS
ncbi:hypothetical protein BGY98DRAFT_957763 [Russula aff. rugulosa BPL654]|nr:hypothetical protein BGY98DRAFT_957763 [Russula aff. rugulosa BPL654]